jgi:hypothetical protein
MCLTTKNTADWGVYCQDLPGAGQPLVVGPYDVLIVRCDNIGFKQIAVGQGAGYLQKTILLYCVVPEDVLRAAGIFDASPAPRDLTINPLTLADFVASESDFRRLAVRELDYCATSLRIAVEILHQPLETLVVGYTVDAEVPTLISCHYKTDFGARAVTALFDETPSKPPSLKCKRPVKYFIRFCNYRRWR